MPCIQRRDAVRIDMAGGGLLVKQSAGLRSLPDHRQMNFPKSHPLDGAVFLSAQENAAVTQHIYIGNGDVAEDTGEIRFLSFAWSRAEKDGFSLSPPAGSAGQRICVGISAHGPRQVMNADMLHRASVPHPDPDAPGAVSCDAVRQDNVADDAMGFRSDFQR